MKAIGLLLAFFLALPANASYSVLDLGSFDGSSAIGFKINDAGIVVGWAENTWGYQEAFRSPQGAPLQALASLSPSDSYALGINLAGVIAGTAYVNGQPHGVIWNGSGATDLGPGIFATGINDSGVVIGGDGHAFVLANGVDLDLGVLPGGDWSSAQGINNAGAVVGDASVSNGNFRGFVWNPQTGMVELGTFGGSNSHATGINAGGEVVGFATLPNGYEHAFSLTAAGMHDLGTLGGSSYAYAINDSGAIVGYSWPTSGDHTHAFLYLDGGMFDLNTLLPPGSGWELLAAYGINNAGQIVGEGLWNGQSRAFLLAPAPLADPPLHNPEPGTASLAIVGSAVILAAVWSRRAKRPAERNL